jgi:hypothetical protein
VPSIPASAGDIMIDEAKPVAVLAAVSAHFSLSAVIKTRPTHIENISAKASSMRVFSYTKYPSRDASVIFSTTFTQLDCSFELIKKKGFALF